VGTEAPDHGTSVENEYLRFLAYGHQLIEIHIGLREMLADLREGVVPEREFGVHCLAFCSAVTRHHTGEDTGVFPFLAARHPELRDFLDGLERDHRVISGLLGGVQSLAAALEADPSRAATIRMELDGLAAILETHFIGEEKRLVAVLNALESSADLPGLTG
jgi:hemerythrin HHE cation binding domain-containing protein